MTNGSGRPLSFPGPFPGHSPSASGARPALEDHRHTPEGQLPRIHDLRHTFAVHALLRWYHAGADVQAKLPMLATYMGHVSIVSTAYYLAFVEPLRTAASARFEQHYGALVSPYRLAKRGRS